MLVDPDEKRLVSLLVPPSGRNVDVVDVWRTHLDVAANTQTEQVQFWRSQPGRRTPVPHSPPTLETGLNQPPPSTLPHRQDTQKHLNDEERLETGDAAEGLRARLQGL